LSNFHKRYMRKSDFPIPGEPVMITLLMIAGLMMLDAIVR